jgi:hypothetical protein
MANESNLPALSITVSNYAEYRDDIQRFADGKYNFLLIVGGTGLSKTETLKEMIGGDPLHYEGGEPTPYQFYCDLYEKIGEFVILDDVSPNFYKRHLTNSYLKVLTNTLLNKGMRWPTATLSETTEPPNFFETTSRVIILTNDWHTSSAHVRALEGRAMSIVFKPTPGEVHHEVGRRGWFKDQEVYDFVWANRKWITQPDMRLYTKIREQKKAGANWRKRGLQMLIGDERLQRVADLLSDPKLTSNVQRAKKFVELGYGGRTLFYECLAEFQYYKEVNPNEAPPKLKGSSKHADKRTVNT